MSDLVVIRMKISAADFHGEWITPTIKVLVTIAAINSKKGFTPNLRMLKDRTSKPIADEILEECRSWDIFSKEKLIF